ncbi:uncharacterized protein BDW47DRAFT_116045 [Aspergillus candidus]|uniref:Uncharacterized protein n=1 Tax=Aspergillus candidus TaxID=41067 RepID=A0A2I2FI02_ASPCN|nr:hypothetical protein BDW47DRAFT_116045 [Aspergillus candidus]PLB40261.1 hypothetical protein BDW47DRAFT_116045 [Aspergillus candidus]
MSPSSHSPDVPQGLGSASWQKLMVSGRKLNDQQDAVSAERSRVRELRTALRYKREEEAEIRISLMKQLNSMFAKNDLLVTERIAKEHDRLQSAMDEYLDLENRYHEEEDQLEQNEYSLSTSMETFLQLLHNGILSQCPDGTLTGLPPCTMDQYSEDYDRYSTISSAPDLPPAVVTYLTRIGDLRVLQESLADLDMQWVETTERQEQRRPHNIPLDEESLEFLQTYDSDRASLWKKIDTTQLDVNQLRSTCEEQGLLTEDYLPGGYDFTYNSYAPAQQQQFEDDTGAQIKHQDTSEEMNERGRPETKLADPLKMPAGRDFSPFSEPWPMTRNHPVEFINNWILHQLRHSSVQIARFKSLPELCELNRAGCHNADISRKALTEWFLDDTIVSTHPSPPCSTAAGDDEGRLTDNNEDGGSLLDNAHDGNGVLYDLRKEKKRATRERKRATITGLMSGAPAPTSGPGRLRDRWPRSAHSV